MIAIVWVADIIIAGSNTDVLKKAKKSLMMRFKMKDLGVLSWFLGIKFKCENDCIEMSQSKFVEKILEAKSSPMQVGRKQSQYSSLKVNLKM